MTISDRKRLAFIRADMEKWAAQQDTSHWDAVFLLRIIDDLIRERKNETLLRRVPNGGRPGPSLRRRDLL